MDTGITPMQYALAVHICRKNWCNPTKLENITKAFLKGGGSIQKLARPKVNHQHQQ